MNHPYHTIRVDCAAHICNITLNRPERRNALTTEMVRELTLAFRSAGKSVVKARPSAPDWIWPS